MLISHPVRHAALPQPIAGPSIQGSHAFPPERGSVWQEPRSSSPVHRRSGGSQSFSSVACVPLWPSPFTGESLLSAFSRYGSKPPPGLSAYPYYFSRDPPNTPHLQPGPPNINLRHLSKARPIRREPSPREKRLVRAFTPFPPPSSPVWSSQAPSRSPV